MKHFLLFLFSLCFFSLSYAQNYQTVNSSEVKLFENAYNSIRGYRIDSVNVINGDSLLYPSRTIQSEDGDWSPCYDIEGPSMLGPYIRVSPNGTNLFFNILGDTIRIETMAQAGTTWKVWAGEEFDVYGEMLVTQTESVLGVQDSVKTIVLNAYDDAMNLIENNPLNGKTISISKNFGLIGTFNFVVFPNLIEGNFQIAAQKYALYGIENLGLGSTNLQTFDVFAFQPGDIIEWEQANMLTGNGSVKQFRHEILNVETYPDSLIQEVKITIFSSNFSLNENEESTVETSLDSAIVTRTVLKEELLEKLPILPVVLPEIGYTSTIMHDGFSLGQENLKSKTVGTIFLSDNDDCYTELIDGTCMELNSTYFEGLGGPYYNCDMGGFISHSELTYFNKNGNEWGTPFDFTVSVEDRKEKVFFELYPNPAAKNVFISLENNGAGAMVEVLDLNGKIIKQEKIATSTYTLSISEMGSGVYFVRIVLDGNIAIKKMVIR